MRARCLAYSGPLLLDCRNVVNILSSSCAFVSTASMLSDCAEVRWRNVSSGPALQPAPKQTVCAGTGHGDATVPVQALQHWHSRRRQARSSFGSSSRSCLKQTQHCRRRKMAVCTYVSDSSAVHEALSHVISRFWLPKACDTLSVSLCDFLRHAGVEFARS